MRPVGQERLWQRLYAAAGEEVQAVLSALPPPLRREAQRIPVTFETKPGRDLIDDGLDEDLLGLFVGESFAESNVSTNALPAQVLLFLENIWEYAGHDPETYREEVRRTLLHELGHYLGLDEDGLASRDLD